MKLLLLFTMLEYNYLDITFEVENYFISNESDRRMVYDIKNVK